MEQAWEDLRAARDLLSTGHFAWCCFLCQQAAEKALKAVLEHLRRREPGHNLLRLLAAISNALGIPEEVRRACTVLNRYYIPAGYPSAFPSGAPVHMFDEQDARGALRYADDGLVEPLIYSRRRSRPCSSPGTPCSSMPSTRASPSSTEGSGGNSRPASRGWWRKGS
ncbi:MAG TPA: HEPN domain-containing protein [Candidatus Bathyarchaeota archaeon]|nr:HEPN domain-containing protein [Candidatus Bathyarchaeota archaeon]